VWPVSTILALVALLALHFWWRGRLVRSQEAADGEIETLKRQQETAAVHEHVRQEAIFNSMVEGLVLLD